MNRLRPFLIAFAAAALLVGPFGVAGQAGASAAVPDASVSASAKAKKKCKKLKGKKKRQCLKKASKKGKGGKGKGGKPWAGSPYKPGITCAMSPEMQKRYAKYGLTCIDLGLGVTTLIEL